MASQAQYESGESRLLKNIPDERLPGFIEEKLAFREQWYSKANITVDGLSLNIDLLRSIIMSGSGN